MLRRNSPVVKSVQSVMEGSLWCERFVKEIGLEPGVKERGSYLVRTSFEPAPNQLA